MNFGYKINAVGLVQGVGFRFFTKKKADELGIHGDVKNLEDGSVKIHAYGSNEKLLLFLEWCHHGPSSAVVESLMYEKIDFNLTSEFQILR